MHGIQSKTVDLIITLLDVFKRAQMKEKAREGNDVADTGSIVILTQTPIAPFTPYSDTKAIFPIASHSAPVVKHHNILI